MSISLYIVKLSFFKKKFCRKFFIDLVCVCIIINRFIKIKAAAAFFKKSQWIVDHWVIAIERLCSTDLVEVRLHRRWRYVAGNEILTHLGLSLFVCHVINAECPFWMKWRPYSTSIGTCYADQFVLIISPLIAYLDEHN